MCEEFQAYLGKKLSETISKYHLTYFCWNLSNNFFGKVPGSIEGGAYRKFLH